MEAEHDRPGGAARWPRNVVVILLDSLNRHLLPCYGGTGPATPNIDRLARRSVRFTNHVTGSLPCMPARHDILCGAIDFLWRPWGSIELWERPITWNLREAEVTTMLVTDHPHLFETGGENYHTDFAAWDYVRGHEGDPWRTEPDPSWIGAPDRPARPARPGLWWAAARYGWPLGEDHRPYDVSRTWFADEADFPGPRVMTAAADWLRRSAPHHDRWFLFVDEFDPHEPFDVAPRWLGRYDDEPWDGDLIIWPPYADGAVTSGHLTEREARHIRANYAAKVSMIDDWLGRVLDAFDAGGLWDDTAVILTTDHGHYLGEQRQGRDLWGKPGVPQYEPISHLPLLIHWPGAPAGTCDALTTAVDLHATLADVFGAGISHRTHGRSLAPLLTGDAREVRTWALGGVYGGWVQVTDGRRKYARGAVGSNFPLSLWSNRWSTMPLPIHGVDGLPAPDRRAGLDRMPGSTIPVIRQPFAPGDRLPFWVNERCVDQHHCFDLGVDPDEGENRAGEALGAEMADLLRTALGEIDAPADQFERLGLA